jgi:hypothetical protein
MPFEGDVAPVAARGREPTTHREFRDAFNEAMLNFGQIIRVRGDGPQVKAVAASYIRHEFRQRHATGETDPKKRYEASRKAFNRALNDPKLWKEYPRWASGADDWVWQAKACPGRDWDMGHGTSS